MRRHPAYGAPEVVPSDIEGGESGKMTSLQRVAPPIIPYQMPAGDRRRRGVSVNRDGSAPPNQEGMKQVGIMAGGVWLVGWIILGYDMLWPVYMVSNIIATFLSVPPLSWIFGWLYRGVPMTSGGALVEEAQLRPNQVSQYLETYVQQYGDAALIFATHDGYPQIVKGLLYNDELGYKDLINARDDAGNTALLYAAAKNFRQCTAALLHAGADPDEANAGAGGRTPLMEAAGGGFRDIVIALRMAPNMTSVDKADDFGNTALHYAAYHGHLSVVLEILKSNPNKDVKNNYGHTPASYALANRYKGVADVLNRAPARSQRVAREVGRQDIEPGGKLDSELQEHLKLVRGMKEERHVKGVAEELHKRDWNEFAPMAEKRMSESEQKAVEEQLSKLNRQYQEAELKAQKRIVELLEKSSELQKALDRVKEEGRSAQLNNTEMSFKISELESKQRSSELRALEEAERVKSLREESKRYQEEADRHRSRAEAAERERDHHIEAARRHEENTHRVQDEVRQHEDRLQKQQREMLEYRERLGKADEEHRRHQDEIDRLQRELRELRTPGSIASRLAGDSTSRPRPAEAGVTEATRLEGTSSLSELSPPASS